MLDRSELNFNAEFTAMFEKWVGDMYPDDHWRLDRVYTEDGWEYKHEHTEDDFIMWVNIKVYSQAHKDMWDKSNIMYKY